MIGCYALNQKDRTFFCVSQLTSEYFSIATNLSQEDASTNLHHVKCPQHHQTLTNCILIDKLKSLTLPLKMQFY